MSALRQMVLRFIVTTRKGRFSGMPYEAVSIRMRVGRRKRLQLWAVRLGKVCCGWRRKGWFRVMWAPEESWT